MGRTVDNQSDLGIVVVLAGTSASKAALDSVAATLRASGRQVELITGLERTFVQLLRVAFRTGANGRYLIFGGPDIPAATLDKAKKGVEANGVAASHLWAGEITWHDHDAAVREVNHRLAAVGIDVGEAPAPSPIAKRPTPPPLPGQPYGAPAQPTPLRPPSVTMRAIPSFAPQPPPTPFPVASVSVPHGMDPTPSGAMAIAAPPTATTHDDDDLLRPPAGPLGRMWSSSAGKAFVGFASVAALGLGVWTLLPADQASAGDATVASASSAAAAADEPSVAAPEGTPMSPNPAAATADVPEQEPEPAQDGDEIEVEVEEDAAPTVESADGDAAAVEVPMGADAELVYTALKNQSIRAVDVLLASPHATKKRGRRTIFATMRWAEANAYCEALVVDGVTGWRLADVGEIGWLSRANVIKSGIYWTATKADAFGDERVVWNVRRKRMTTAGMKWRGGRAICVRFQVPGDGPK